MLAKTTLQIVCNDEREAHALTDLLEQPDGFRVEAANAGGWKPADLDGGQFDLVLLDAASVDPPDAAKIRRAAAKSDVVCIELAPADAERPADGAKAFRKPFRIKELAAFIGECQARKARTGPASVRMGPLLVNPVERTCRTPDGRVAALTEKELSILLLLKKSPRGFATSRDLMADVWGYHESASSRTLQTHIYALRQKLERDPGNPEHLLTDKGGYRLAV